MGILMLAIAAAAATLMQWTGVPAWLRLLLFAPIGIGLLGVLQARGST